MLLRACLPLMFVVLPGSHALVCAQVATSPISHTPAHDNVLLVSDGDIQTIRKDIRSLRKQLIAANVKLTDAEAERFWPVYDRYVSELDQIDDTKYALIKQDIDTGGALSDADAELATKQWAEIDTSVAQLRMKYITNFRNVLSSRKTALFWQLERQVQLVIDERLTSSLPVLEP
jgi:hypothetical protein